MLFIYCSMQFKWSNLSCSRITSNKPLFVVSEKLQKHNLLRLLQSGFCSLYSNSISVEIGQV